MPSTLSNADHIRLSIKRKEIPRFLYKYRSIDENLKRIIEEGSLWFSNPLAFNDPFDCQIQIDGSNTNEEINRFLNDRKPQLSSKTIYEIEAKIKEQPDSWGKMIKKIISEKINSKGICCFSSQDNNILLWSHYGDCHKGVCLKFDVEYDPDFFVTPIKVEYTKAYPKYNHVRDNDRLIKLLIQSKAKIWEYEQEYRIMKNEKGAYQFAKNSLKEITFGCNTSEAKISYVKRIVKNSGYTGVVFQKATVKMDRYALDFSHI